MDVYHAVIIVLLILILWWIVKKCGAEGLIIPNSAGPVSKGELMRLVKGGIPLAKDQYLMEVSAQKMARLETFNPDSPMSTEGYSVLQDGYTVRGTVEGFTMTNGVDVTGTDLQRQLYTGVNAADRYTVKPARDGYLVGGIAGGTSGLANGLTIRPKHDAYLVRGGTAVKNPYASQNVRGPSIPRS